MAHNMDSNNISIGNHFFKVLVQIHYSLSLVHVLDFSFLLFFNIFLFFLLFFQSFKSKFLLSGSYRPPSPL